MMKRLDLGLFIALIALAAAAAGLGFDAPASKAPAAPQPPALTPTLGPTATPTPVPPLPGSPTPAWWPVRSPGLDRLSSIAGLSDADLWAIGATTTYHGDGTSWTPVPVPTSSWGQTYLMQASAGAADSLWATGGDATSGGAVVMHGDGQHWTIIDEEPSQAGRARPALDPLRLVRRGRRRLLGRRRSRAHAGALQWDGHLGGAPAL